MRLGLPRTESGFIEFVTVKRSLLHADALHVFNYVNRMHAVLKHNGVANSKYYFLQ